MRTESGGAPLSDEWKNTHPEGGLCRNRRRRSSSEAAAHWKDATELTHIEGTMISIPFQDDIGSGDEEARRIGRAERDRWMVL
jgi:hypothetical protein